MAESWLRDFRKMECIPWAIGEKFFFPLWRATSIKTKWRWSSEVEKLGFSKVVLKWNIQKRRKIHNRPQEIQCLFFNFQLYSKTLHDRSREKYCSWVFHRISMFHSTSLGQTKLTYFPLEQININWILYYIKNSVTIHEQTSKEIHFQSMLYILWWRILFSGLHKL